MNGEHPARSHPEPGPPPRSWNGTGRYETVRLIGQGGMGVVYEAIDHEQHRRVALKTLLNFTPEALYRFKREFRTLADVLHRNLVRLHEFVMTDDDHVFFTMELVEGVDFRTYVCRADRRDAMVRTAAPSTALTTRASPRSLRGSAPADVVTQPMFGQSPADMGLLRSALLGLAEGIQALHRAGQLHRDVKPSNVLVTQDGRVVLLDFGVATELSGLADERSEMVGTACYMAPEQGRGGPLTTASDWYSVGVVLYEALVGIPPFAGTAFHVLREKSAVPAFPPSVAVTGVPEDLDLLCRDLLQIEPGKRPDGVEVLRRLRQARGARSVSLPPVAEAVFVGREQQLAALRDAFEVARGGQSITVRVIGSSGMGKSTLVQRFLDEVSKDARAVVLRGRAYERESVPYKAVDGIVDSLSRYLMRRSDAHEPLELSSDIWALARLFPVLRRVPSVAATDERRVSDPREVRALAIASLRALLATIGRRHPVVIFIDDVQWGDADSADLLIELTRPPKAPPVMLILTYRDGESPASSFLAETEARRAVGAEVREIEVGPLAPSDAQRLAFALLDHDDGIGLGIAHGAARESRGSPFLIVELVRSNLTIGPRAEDTLRILTVDQMVGERLARMPESARRLLEIVAVGGRPLPLPIAAEAACISEGVDDVVALAVSRRFARTGLRGGQETIDISHDRIRQAVLARLLPATLREWHGRLAAVLESTPGTDLEALAAHLRGAGKNERAAEFAERAAEEAEAKLAFDQADRLYRMALDTIAEGSPNARRLLTRLARVLEWSGRGPEAAEVYLRAAEGAPSLDRVELERAAAEQLLTSGRIDQGISVLDRALSSLGVGRPHSAVTAILWLLLYRLYLRFRGLGFEQRSSENVPRLDRARIDILYSVAIGLSFVDAIQAACMQARGLILALRGGDRFQAARACAVQYSTFASAGGEPTPQECQLQELVRGLAETAPEPDQRAFYVGNLGIAHFLRGQWKLALDTCDAAVENSPNNRATWQATGRLFALWSLEFLGRMAEFRERHARLLADAERRGDLYTTVSLRIGYSNLAWLAVDDVEGARRHVQDAMTLWSRDGYHVQHYRAILAEANRHLYLRAGARAYDCIAKDWPKLKKSFLLRVQYLRADATFARARAAVASIDGADDDGVRIEEAERLARRLSGEGMPWTEPLAAIIRAGVACARGNRAHAIGSLREGVTRADASGMAMHATAIRYQLGRFIGGESGDALVDQAEGAMKMQGIREPGQFAAMLVPGAWGAP